MKNKKEALAPDGRYHIYNRANGSESLFRNADNYRFFLEKYKKFIFPIAKTYVYCLMPNHFHFLIGVREEREIAEIMLKRKNKFKTQTLEGFKKEKTISTFLSQQFSHLFNSYTQAYNKQNRRRGSLFTPSYKRKRIEDDAYQIQLVRYIHFNPVKAGLCEKLEAWEFSSFKTILSKKPTELQRQAVLEWFGDKENFKYCHQNPLDFNP